MHPFQMETMAQQRWDELVSVGAAARHNRRAQPRSSVKRRVGLQLVRLGMRLV
jgi:hypothetical protein